VCDLERTRQDRAEMEQAPKWHIPSLSAPSQGLPGGCAGKTPTPCQDILSLLLRRSAG